MTTQEAYESIRAYFNEPGATLAVEAVTPYPRCSYRTTDGAKCAVGCLIPDDLYDPRIEGKSIEGVLKLSPSLRGHFRDVDPKFLLGAQRLHDAHAKDVGLFVELLDLLAIAHGLTLVVDFACWSWV
jgi:hypothetical protein